MFKLIGNLLNIPISITTATIIPRILGPGNYGDYKFLVFSFTQVSNFIGTGNNFLGTRLAKNHYNRKLISFYWNYVFSAVIISLICMISISLTPMYNDIFPNQELVNIWIVFFLVIAILIRQILETMTDTCGLTTTSSIISFLVRAISFVFFIIILYVFGLKNLFGVFAYQFFLFGLLIIGLSGVLLTNKIPMYPFSVSLKNTKDYIRKYYEYSSPLFFLAIIGLPLNFLRRWLLQSFGGSVEQGYFSLSDTLSSFVIMFSNSLTPLLLREFSISNSKNDHVRMSSLFVKSLYILFAFSAYMSIFLMIQSSKATIILGGTSFTKAILPVSIMILYPIPYTVNNILYTVLYSTNKTKLLRNVIMISSGVSLLITFILIAPSRYFGLNMGAVGFAISMVSVTLMIYLVLLRFCVSILNLSWKTIIINHLIVTSVFVSFGFVTARIGDHITNNSVVSFIISGMLYTISVVFVFYKFPSLIGTSTKEIFGMIRISLSKANLWGGKKLK